MRLKLCFSFINSIYSIVVYGVGWDGGEIIYFYIERMRVDVWILTYFSINKNCHGLCLRNTDVFLRIFKCRMFPVGLFTILPLVGNLNCD